MGAFKKGMHLRQCFYVTVIHDGIHPSIMNRNQAMSVSFRVGNTTPVQYHFILEKTMPCLSGSFVAESPPLWYPR